MNCRAFAAANAGFDWAASDTDAHKGCIMAGIRDPPYQKDKTLRALCGLL